MCDDGWAGSDCSENIDDCADNSCANGGTCLNQVDGFTCLCTPAWKGVTCGEGKDISHIKSRSIRQLLCLVYS